MKLLILPFLLLLPQDDIQETVDRFLSVPGLKKARVGIHIYSPEKKAKLYGHADEERYILASNTKVLTCATALDQLGPDYRFRTALYIEVEGESATLYVRGTGDPTISGRTFNGDPTRLFKTWAEKLKSKGIRKIREIVLCNSGWDSETTPPDWKRYTSWHYYAAPYGTYSLNDNCLDLTVSPGAPGAPAKIKIVPDTRYVVIRNNLKTVKGKARKPWGFSRKDGTNIITFHGEISTRAKAVTKWVSIYDPYQFYGTVALETLRNAGFDTSSAAVRTTSRKEERGKVLLDLYETKMSTVVSTCLTVSQNFYAEMILRALGREKKGVGSRKNGLRVVRQFLRKIGITQYEQSDGSGLARTNRMSPRDIAKIFRHMQTHRHAGVFYDALAINGAKIGTLRRRMKAKDVIGRVHAKTGHVSGVSNLSGYVKTRSGKTLIFSVLCNQGTYGPAHKIQHQVCEYLIRNH